MAKPELHYHACTHCRRRYPDACTSAGLNSVCPSCVMGRDSIHMQGIAPRPCCHQHLRVANRVDLKTYRLAGPGPWWLCGACGRQFGYDVRIANA